MPSPGRLGTTLKGLVRPVVYHPGTNRALRALLRPCRSWLPEIVLARFPISGSFSLTYPGVGRIGLVGEGLDDQTNRLFWYGPFGIEAPTLRALLALLPGSGTLVDAGAYIGLVSLLASREDPNRQVFSFEPMPMARERIRKNLQLNGITNVVVEGMALWKEPGTGLLQIPRHGIPSSSSLRPEFREGVVKVEVEQVRLDDYLGGRGAPRVGILKVDTETSEPEVLAGASRTLAKDRPYVFCEVLHGQRPGELERVLGPLAYRYFHLRRDGIREVRELLGDPAGEEDNFLFIPEERVEKGQVPLDLSYS